MATLFNRNVTVIELIKRAYRLIGVYSIGETPTADEAVDGLTALNAMLDEWSTESLMIPAMTLDVITLTPNVATYTIGATGGTVSDRPVEISEASYIQYGTLSYPIDILTLAEYNELTLKSLSTQVPQSLLYRATYPNATITLYPIPAAVMTLNLWSSKQLNVFQYLTDVINMPPAYENAIVFNLAKELANEFSVQLSNQIMIKATSTKRKLKRVNFEPPMLSLDDVVPTTNSRFNIIGGRRL